MMTAPETAWTIMTNPAVNFLAFALYAAVGALLWRRLARADAAAGGAKLGILSLGFGAVVLHAALLYAGLRADSGINLALTGAFSLVAWVVAVVYLLAAFTRPIENLGVIIMPLAGLTLLAAWLWPGRLLLAPASALQSAHIVVSILAYSLLTLAAAQSVLLLVQERHLHHKHPGGFIRALPPMQTMEALMFQLIGIGFLLLTLTVVSGALFSEAVFGQPFKFTHHMVLSVFGWAVYAVLLLGRRRLGWRGRTAVRWTLGGFLLLLLGYFGSKFVLEILLGR